MQHQDWETVVLRKPVTIVNPASKSKPKELKEGDEFNVAKVSTELKRAIQQARTAKKMSQKELASALNVPKQDIIKYENGTIIPSNAYIRRIEVILKTKLPRCKKK